MSEKGKKILPEAAGRFLLLSAETYGKMTTLLQLLDSTFDPDVFEVKQGARGRTVTLRDLVGDSPGGGGSSSVCVLGELSADAANAGKFVIRPGYVSGGGGSEELEEDNITATIGQHLYVKVDWTGNVEDDVLLEGGEMTGASIEQGSSVPDDDVLTAESETGSAYVPLGFWSDDGASNPVWNRAGCGSVSIKFCPQGGFYFIRQ